MDIFPEKLYFSIILEDRPMSNVDRNPVDRFGLFGEAAGSGDPEFFHIEDIQARSQLYRWKIAPHVHTRMFQLIWLDSGPVRLEIEGVGDRLKGPLAICVPGNVVHSFEFDAQSVGHVVTVSEAMLPAGQGRDGAIDLGFFRQRPRIIACADAAARGRIAGLLDQMSEEFNRREAGREVMFVWLLQAAMVLLQRQAAHDDLPAGKDGYRRDVFVRLERLIEEHYRDQWDLQAYAGMLAIGSQRLNRICREFAGKTVAELVHERVTLEAQRHLIYTAAPVEAIAYELGFKDPGYFCRFFKRRSGVSPGAYRRAREAA